MSKFFLNPPKPKGTSSDFKIISFREVQKSLKRFKLFKTQKIIKKIKGEPTDQPHQLQVQLDDLKHITPSMLNKVTVHLLNSNGFQLESVKVFLNKLMSCDVQSAIDTVDLQMTKSNSPLQKFMAEFKQSQLYLRAKEHITMLKKNEKKKIKIREKRASGKIDSKSKPDDSKKLRRSLSNKAQVGSDDQVKIRYARKPIKFQPKVSQAPQRPSVQVDYQPKEMHPSWAAKKQENKIQPFTGKKISLV